MKNNATITLTSTQGSDKNDKIELVTQGSFYHKNGSWYIFYDESSKMGMADCSVMIKVSDEEVVVSRKGAFSSKMIYKTGVTNEFLYHMPYGAISVVLTTRQIEFSFDENGGDLYMAYLLSLYEGENENELKIKVKAE